MKLIRDLAEQCASVDNYLNGEVFLSGIFWDGMMALRDRMMAENKSEEEIARFCDAVLDLEKRAIEAMSK